MRRYAKPWKSDTVTATSLLTPTAGLVRVVEDDPMLRERRTPWPGHRGRQRFLRPLQGASAVVTFIGHSTFLLQTPAGNILTDPVFVRAPVR